MGMLTPILIRNDWLEDIKNHPEEFVNEILRAANTGHSTSLMNGAALSLGYNHSSHDRVLVVIGNTWIDLMASFHQVESDCSAIKINFLFQCIKIVKEAIRSINKKIKEQSLTNPKE